MRLLLDDNCYCKVTYLIAGFEKPFLIWKAKDVRFRFRLLLLRLLT